MFRSIWRLLFAYRLHTQADTTLLVHFKDLHLYVIALGWPESGTLTVKSLKQAEKIGKVRLLGSDARLQWSLGKDGLKITLPDAKPCDHAFVFRIEK